MSSGKSEAIRQQCYAMRNYQRLDILGDNFREAFRCGWPTIYETPEQAFLSGMVGSGWGTFFVRHRIEADVYTIERRPEGNRQVYTDPDRKERS